MSIGLWSFIDIPNTKTICLCSGTQNEFRDQSKDTLKTKLTVFSSLCQSTADKNASFVLAFP